MVEVSELRSLLAKRFGLHVRTFRERAALTQAALAKRSGLSVDSVRRIERGAFSPSLDSIAKLCAGLQISIPVFFEAFERPEVGLPGQIAGYLRGRSAGELKMVWRVLRALAREDGVKRATPHLGELKAGTFERLDSSDDD
jgi:transcriptional regulator with XRE-family HTH domain